MLKMLYMNFLTQWRYNNYIGADKCYIKYINKDTHPYVQKWEIMPKSNFINWLFKSSYYKYTIYLLKGSIIEMCMKSILSNYEAFMYNT